MVNKAFLAFAILAIFFSTSCTGNKKLNSDLPSWYVSPNANNSENFYGVSQGYTLEEATKASLADAASRLMVSISSQSSFLQEESKTDINEESRLQIKQNIEKIDFTNFKVSQSKKVGPKIFVEVKIKRSPFIHDQKEKVRFLERKISDQAKRLTKSNPIQSRASLLKIIELSKKVELSSRILKGAGEDINLQKKLANLAKFEDKLNSLNHKIEFFLKSNSSAEVSRIIRSSLNKDKIAVSRNKKTNSDQILLSIKSSSRSNQIYGAYITKIQINFENILKRKVIASNIVEVTGSSAISKKESYKSALNSLKKKISQDGILETIGIIQN